MALFSLTPNPMFKADVDIPVPGGSTVKVNFTFKHKTRSEFKEFFESLQGREDADIILDIAAGWGLKDDFSRENVEQLTENYIGSARAILDKYVQEISGARRGN